MKEVKPPIVSPLHVYHIALYFALHFFLSQCKLLKATVNCFI